MSEETEPRRRSTRTVTTTKTGRVVKNNDRTSLVKKHETEETRMAARLVLLGHARLALHSGVRRSGDGGAIPG